MSIEHFFDHKCNIYHLQKKDQSIGFSLPTSPSFNYADVPDIANVPCHFGVKYFYHDISQGQPANDYTANIKLALPIGTDIQRNDKIVSLETGLEYTAKQPRNVRGHHLFVFIKRNDAQKSL